MIHPAGRSSPLRPRGHGVGKALDAHSSELTLWHLNGNQRLFEGQS